MVWAQSTLGPPTVLPTPPPPFPYSQSAAPMETPMGITLTTTTTTGNLQHTVAKTQNSHQILKVTINISSQFLCKYLLVFSLNKRPICHQVISVSQTCRNIFVFASKYCDRDQN